MSERTAEAIRKELADERRRLDDDLDTLQAELRSFVPYLIAGLLFVTFGVIEPRFMLNWSPGIILLVLVAWAIPAAWRRWRRR